MESDSGMGAEYQNIEDTKMRRVFTRRIFFILEIVMEIQRFGVQILVLYFDYNISQRITFGNIFLVQRFVK